MPIELPALFRQNWSSPSAGNAYLVPVYAGSLSAGVSRRAYVRKLAGELPIWGARRVQNLLPVTSPGVWAVNGQAPGLTPVFAGIVGGPDGLLSAARWVFRPRGGGFSLLQQEVSIGRPISRAATALWVKNVDGAPSSTMLYTGAGGAGPSGPLLTSGSWTRIGVAGVTGGGSSIGFALYCFGPSDVTMDIACYGDFCPTGEDLSGTTQGAPSEQLCSHVDYGFGVPGVRYFDYACGNSISNSGTVIEAQGYDIPDVGGVRPLPAATTQNTVLRHPLFQALEAVASPAATSIAGLPADVLISTGAQARFSQNVNVVSGQVYTQIAIVGGPARYVSLHGWDGTMNVHVAVFDLQANTFAVPNTPNGWSPTAFMLPLGSGAALIGVSFTPTKSWGDFPCVGPALNLSNYMNPVSGTTISVAHNELTLGPFLGALMRAESGTAVSRLPDVAGPVGATFGSDWTLFAEVELQSVARRIVAERLIGTGIIGQTTPLTVGGQPSNIGIWNGTNEKFIACTSPGLYRLISRMKDGLLSLFVNGTEQLGNTPYTWFTGSVGLYIGQSDGTYMGSTTIRKVRLWPDIGLHDELCLALTASDSVL